MSSSSRSSAGTKKSRVGALIGLAMIAMGIGFGPYGLLIARESGECIGVCYDQAAIFTIGSIVGFIAGLFLLLEFWLRD